MDATLAPAPSPSTSRTRWAGRVLTALPTMFLAFDATIKLVGEPHAVEATARLEVPGHLLGTIGALELACLALYVIPRTAFLGALLLTGFLGGAVAAHVRLGDPLATHSLFPVYVAALCWAGLALRDSRVLALFLGRGGAAGAPHR
jgi:hypothetical protein